VRHLSQPRRQVAGRRATYELRSPPPGVDKAPLPQPSALITPIGHDTSVPWSRHDRAGFLASDRYCWWKQHLSEWRPAKISIFISQPTGRRRHARERFGLVIKAG
jgi:hypothetical protein